MRDLFKGIGRVKEPRKDSDALGASHFREQLPPLGLKGSGEGEFPGLDRHHLMGIVPFGRGI